MEVVAIEIGATIEIDGAAVIGRNGDLACVNSITTVV